jgi:hypothetical protein
LCGEGVGESVAIEANANRQKLSMLMILQATCKTTLQTLEAVDNALDHEFAADLERIIARTEREMQNLRP